MNPNSLVRPSPLLYLAVIIWIILETVTTHAASSSEVETLADEGARNYRTKEGQHYQEQFGRAVTAALAAALGSCKNEPDTKEPAMIVFVIAADGRIKRLLYSPHIPFGECVAAKLRSILTLPRPPRDNWVVSLGAANHHHEETAKKGPPDKPIPLGSKAQLDAYDKAIAPYVAKARATYPLAKKRFLSGLPSGHKFVVRTRLTDSHGKVEDCLVQVESIKDGNITGTINRVDILDNYKAGQRVAFSESRIDNWLILRPDGTEEGNYVGKFLDHYKPR